MKNLIERESGFPSCVGFLDGTTVIFDIKPISDHESYYSRKSRYGINVQIVSDWVGRIRFLFAGFPASVHDSRCIRNSPIIKCKSQFFEGHEYVLADVAYTLSETVITPFKKPTSNSQPYRSFNRVLSSARVRIQHCIGRLKGRFQSIRGLRTVIKSRKDNRRANKWISACAIVHNMLIGVDDWEEEDMQPTFPEFKINNRKVKKNKKAAAKRSKIMDIVLERMLTVE